MVLLVFKISFHELDKAEQRSSEIQPAKPTLRGSSDEGLMVTSEWIEGKPTPRPEIAKINEVLQENNALCLIWYDV